MGGNDLYSYWGVVMVGTMQIHRTALMSSRPSRRELGRALSFEVLERLVFGLFRKLDTFRAKFVMMSLFFRGLGAGAGMTGECKHIQLPILTLQDLHCVN